MFKQRKTTFWVGSCVLVGVVVYLLTPDSMALFRPDSFFLWRRQAVLLSGVIAWVLMTLCMVIALRPVWLDRMAGGLDKAYGVHKWAGIVVTVTLTLHWLTYKSAGWLVGLGWLAPRVRPAGAGHPWWHIAAKYAGEYGFYILLVLALVALVQLIPYKVFAKVHKMFPVVYLMGAFHAVAIMPHNWWSSPTAYFVLVLALIGGVAALISLAQSIGRPRRIKAKVMQVRRDASGIIDVTLQPCRGEALAYKPGQFAFVDFGFHEGHHPFTVVSVDTQEVRFAIKELGDFTNKLGTLLQPGQQVEVEGPYGQFQFQSEQPRQVWIAAGIGVTPFMAKLQSLATEGGTEKPIDFWYCTKTQRDGVFPEQLDVMCARAGVSLHRVYASSGERLTPAAVYEVVPDLDRTSVWFCGPAPFAKAIRSGLQARGLASCDFHAERFAMR